MLKIPQCTFCTREAGWVRPWDKVKLCKQHFNSQFTKKVQRTINKYKLLKRNDKIVVGLSGGKDSVVLLETLKKLQRGHQTELIAVTVDEGITGYRKDGLKFAKNAAKKAEVEHVIVSFEEKIGVTLDNLLTKFDMSNTKRLGACSYCGVFRRKLLNETSRDLGADKLATGHNADDEAQTILMNVLSGNVLKTLRSLPEPQLKDNAFVPRVKPFRWTSEEEIVLYAHFNNLKYQETPCPNSLEAHRGVIRDILTNYKEKSPGVIFSILKSGDDIINLNPTQESSGILNRCINCNEPSTKLICKACEIQNQLQEI